MESLEPELLDLPSARPERLLERTVRLAQEAGCAPVVVVLGFAAKEILAACALGDARIVINPDWQSGMASSLRSGLDSLEDLESLNKPTRDAPGTVVLACDQPAVTAAHLRELVERGLQTGYMVSSAYAGRCGIPAYFPRERTAELKQMQGDKGARDLLVGSDALALANGELDVDTEDSLQAARAMMREQRLRKT